MIDGVAYLRRRQAGSTIRRACRRGSSPTMTLISWAREAA